MLTAPARFFSSSSFFTLNTNKLITARLKHPAYTFHPTNYPALLQHSFSSTPTMAAPPPDEVITAYDKSSFIKNFEQKLPGEDNKMEPLAEHTKVERWTREGEPYLEEYAGKGLLKGKAALITGGDSGIGRTVAIFFAREGADVTINYLPEEEEDAQNVKKEIEAAGRKALLIPGDLRDTAVRQKVVDEHLKAFKYIDVLVNNASQQIQCKDIAEIDEQNVRDTFESNIIQYILLSKLAVPHMKRGSNIINTTSVTAYKGSPGMLDYSCTK